MSAASFTTNESSQVLLVSVHNVIYPITEYVLHRVFDPYGYVEKIDILQSSQLLQVVVQFDSCQNAAWAKNQLQGRYIYDGCCQLDIQFYKSFGNEIAADMDFIKHELQRMIVITDRMQERIKTMNCSIQKYADAVSRSSQSAKLKVNSNTVQLKSSSVMSMSSAVVAPTQDLPPTSKSLNLTKSPAIPMKLLLKTSTKVAAPAKIFSPLAETKVSTTKEYAQTQVNLFFHLLSAFSGRMLSQIQCFEFGKLYPIVMMLSVMFDTNEYKMFGLMLERNGSKTLEKVVFIFDPGGVLRMSKSGPMKKYSYLDILEKMVEWNAAVWIYLSSTKTESNTRKRFKNSKRCKNSKKMLAEYQSSSVPGNMFPNVYQPNALHSDVHGSGYQPSNIMPGTMHITGYYPANAVPNAVPSSKLPSPSPNPAATASITTPFLPFNTTCSAASVCIRPGSTPSALYLNNSSSILEGNPKYILQPSDQVSSKLPCLEPPFDQGISYHVPVGATNLKVIHLSTSVFNKHTAALVNSRKIKMCESKPLIFDPGGKAEHQSLLWCVSYMVTLNFITIRISPLQHRSHQLPTLRTRSFSGGW